LSSIEDENKKDISKNVEENVEPVVANEENVEYPEVYKDDSDNAKIDLIKKYTLKPNEFYKKTIFIVNDNIKDSVDILSDLLYKLSLKKDIDTLYNNKLHIISGSDNKKIYRQMLLENPYLYFTDFDVKTSLSKRKISELDDKRNIFIFDVDVANDYKDFILELSQKNVHIFIIANDEDKLLHTLYTSIGNNKLLIYKPTKLKMIHKKFYKNYIRHLCDENNFDQYYNKINNENIDIKYIILKENQLRYN
jgi:hypothetical protein